MKLGVMIEAQEGLNWDRWRRIVAATEQLGFESLWRSDHFFSLMGARGQDALETMVSLVHVAENTSRIRFGPLVCAMTFRHPAVLARMAAGIDQLSGGRFVLGIGAGWNLAEHDAFGIGLPPVKERMDRLEEGARVIRSLWEQESVTFSGKVFSLSEARLNPKPLQHPAPILVGGSGEKRTLRVVARYADEWNSGPMPLERYREKVAALEAHCERAQRDPGTIARSVMTSFAIGANDAEVRHRAEFLRDMATLRRQEAAPDPVESARMRGWLTGTPDQVIEQIKAYEARGVSRIMLQHLNMDDFEVLDLIAKEIIPRV